MEARWPSRHDIDTSTSHWQYGHVPDDDRYSLTELADLAGVTPRTVRYYLGQGLLPAVGQTGPGSKYDAGHLTRLRLIRRLQAEHLPLAEIRRQLEPLDDGAIRDLAGEAGPTPPADSALEYLRAVLGGTPAPPSRQLDAAESSARSCGPVPAPVAAVEHSQWERVVLSPGIELHIRRPLTRARNKGVDRLITIARELLEEGQT
jgi:DNA-binding transcriptional MerR regulator